ncbi:MAG TPA: PQQ-binding-like beta-propeller repeat protein [Gemmataceae bacterium]|nr:PQQ-binding-like beta-propeller repeat protein [Gemmataceae bacterium]
MTTVLFLAAILAPAQPPAEWPCFGGSPARNMVAEQARNLPDTWDVRPGKERNVLWSAKVGSHSFGGPVVSGGKVFVGTNNESPRNLRDTKNGKPINKSVLMCFRAADGKFLWQHVNDKLPEPHSYDWPKFGICSTPFVDGELLYYVTNRCEVVCLDVEGFANGNQGVQDEQYRDPTDADVIWRFDMRKELGVAPCRMSASSPLVVGDLVYVITGNGVDVETGQVAAPDAPSFLALDKKTGRVVWKDSSPGKGILHGQWSSPAYGLINGKLLLVFAGGDGKLRGFEPKTGRRLWEIDGNPPKTEAKFLNHFVATPMIANNCIFIGTGRNPEYDNGPGTLWAFSFAKGMPMVEWAKDNEFRNSNDRHFQPGRTISTCAAQGEFVYFAQLNGIVWCLEADTGFWAWEHNLKSPVWSSPLCADGKVYFATRDGDVYVFAAGREKKLLGKIEMGTPIVATPCAVDEVLYVLTDTQLYALKRDAKK